MRAAIAIDRWKLPIFERYFARAGHAHTWSDGLTEDTMFLYVETDNGQALAQVILAANTEAARTKLNESKK